MNLTHSTEKSRLDYLRSVIEEVARHKFGVSEAAKDCVVIFLEQAFAMPEAQEWPISADAAARINAAAERCVESEARRLRRLRSRETFILDLAPTYGGEAEPSSTELGPEQRVLLSGAIDLILSAVEQFSFGQRSLFMAVFFDSKSPTEVAREIGKTQQSIDRSVRRLRVAIVKALSALGLTDSEVSDLMSYLDRCRFGDRCTRFTGR